MTHEELIANLLNNSLMGTPIATALLRVVELHKPWETLPQLNNPLVWCEICQEDYPCPTIQAIEKELE